MSILKVSIRQVKAARALLAWSQADLAKASGISEPTIKRLEARDDDLGGNADTRDKIRAALERSGVEFIPENGGGAGVRLRKAPLSPTAIAEEIEKLEAKAAALKPEDGPPSPTKALKTMKRAVVKNEVKKLRNKLVKAKRSS